jgi:hypothetical protein
MTTVTFLPEGIVEGAVKVTIIVLVVFKLHGADEIDMLRMETVHEAMGIENSGGKMNIMAGLLPNYCPRRKLKVAELLAVIAVLLWFIRPLELLKLVAIAFTGVLSLK